MALNVPYGVGMSETDSQQTAASPHRSVFIDDAAQLLGVSRRTVYNRIREGRLRTIRTRCGSQRVLVESVAELLRAMHGVSPPGGVTGQAAGA